MTRSLLPPYACLIGLLAAIGIQASYLTPPTLPLVVRNPYLNTHLANARDVPWSKWPIFWTGQEVGLSIMASVPGSSLVYPLLGRPHDSLPSEGESNSYNISFPAYLGANYDASTTNLTYEIPAPSNSSSRESLRLTVSFLSPITPTSTVRQSIPASYIEISVSGSFDVDVYIDLNGLWVTAERGAWIEWGLEEIDAAAGPSLRSFKVKRSEEMKFAEINDRAEYGKLYFSGPSDATYQAGTSGVLRQSFARHGLLRNHVDNRFRSVMDDEPVFAFHKAFHGRGTNSTGSSKCLFTIAHIRDEVAQFASARGLTEMRPLWSSYHHSDQSLLKYHYFDFKNAKKLADAYSAQITYDAGKFDSQEHLDILALSARQVLGATDFTGTPDNPLLFMKEISSDGNCQTIDVIFPSFPFFAYTNPRWLAYTLEPLLEHMLSGQYPNKYAMHDLGFHYPNLTGHPLGRDEYMPVEESGDMLIMALSLVHSLVDGVTGRLSDMNDPFKDTYDIEASDGQGLFPLGIHSHDDVDGLDEPLTKGLRSASQAKSWVKKSYRLWKQWTEYLVEFSLEPANQLSTDDFAGWLPLQTNLALKGIVGIKAMGELASVIGNHDEVKYYKNISDTYIKKWHEFGISRDGSHAKLAYNWYGSWTTLYSIFADAFLCFHTEATESTGIVSPGLDPKLQAPLGHESKGKNNGSSKAFIPHSIYRNQSSYYALALQKFGLPLDSRHLYAKSDWEFQVAAAASPTLRREIIQRVAVWLNETRTSTPFSDLYQTEDEGDYAPGTRFTARPVIGSHFSILAMDKACGGKAVVQDWDLDRELENLKMANSEKSWIIPNPPPKVY